MFVESRKRRARDWEENDYYDSDEDTFLDRTGTIEKKREKRMKVKQPEKAETYDGLVSFVIQEDFFTKFCLILYIDDVLFNLSRWRKKKDYPQLLLT